MKNLTGRKVGILDELEIKNAKNSLYCILQYDNLDKEKRSIFKCGMSIDFGKRIHQYHTSSGNQGIYIIALITNIKLPLKTRSISGTHTITSYLLKAEKYLFQQLERNGAERIKATTHIRDGNTEQFFSTEKIIHESFELVKQQYQGEMHLYTLGDDFEKKLQEQEKKAKFVGKIIFV